MADGGKRLPSDDDGVPGGGSVVIREYAAPLAPAPFVAEWRAGGGDWAVLAAL
ncbi:hypothetical protein LPJ61_006192, partial [Coemansia biformis]